MMLLSMAPFPMALLAMALLYYDTRSSSDLALALLLWHYYYGTTLLWHPFLE
jgi:hypothetical protein